jgi:RNA polymerase primary sigma factor
LILSNLRLVVSIAKKYAYTNIPMMDLIQEGSMGLMKAIDLFEVRKGYRLSTYATWWIRQFISRSIPNTSRTIRIPVYVYESLFAIHKAKQQYFIEHGFELDIKTLSNITNIAVDTLKIIVLCSDDAISLDQPIRDDDYNSLIDFTQDKYNLNPDELYKAKMLDEFVLNIINVLDEREQAIIKMRFGIECDEKTLEEIGKNYNISKERVRQIQKRAIDKLRDHLAKLSDEYIYFYDTN